MQKTIGIIGFGNMGSAIAERIKSKYKVLVFDKDKGKTCGLAGITVADKCADLVTEADVIILAVKPQDFNNVLSEIKSVIKNKLVISIAAGITTRYIENKLGRERVIRVMPNLPAKIGKAISCLCKGKYAYKRDLVSAKKIFESVGKVKVIGEEMMNAATAVSGSGPGFWAYQIAHRPKKTWRSYSASFFIPEFSSAAESVGFGKKDAKLLAATTTSGAIAIVDSWHISPEELKNKVASKGGTTEAGLKVLQRPRGNLKKAVKAALKRARELSK